MLEPRFVSQERQRPRHDAQCVEVPLNNKGHVPGMERADEHNVARLERFHDGDVSERVRQLDEAQLLTVQELFDCLATCVKRT